jgi:hypothetical protein
MVGTYTASGFEPSVAQPPFPLQEFLPLHPLSLALHPPWPLQSFFPLQECLSPSAAKDTLLKEVLPGCNAAPVTFAVTPAAAGTGVADSLAAVPLSKPVIAAVNIRDFVEVFIFVLLIAIHPIPDGQVGGCGRIPNRPLICTCEVPRNPLLIPE